MSSNRNSQTSSATRSTDESAPTSRRVSAIAHEAIDSASERAEQVEKKLREEAGRIAEKSSETAAEAKKRLDDSISGLDKFIRQRPFTAAGIAFAAGVVGALLIKKSATP